MVGDFERMRMDIAFDRLQAFRRAGAGMNLPALGDVLPGEVEAEAARGAGNQGGRYGVVPC
jgi:hypothetical protein